MCVPKEDVVRTNEWIICKTGFPFEDGVKRKLDEKRRGNAETSR